MEQPFGFSLYHMVSVPKTGDTAFVPLNDLIESLSSEMRCRWERLWMVPDRRDRTIHPLIYPHPATNLPTDEIGRYIHPATNLPVSRLPTCISNKLGYFNYTPFIQIQKNTDWSSKRGCENNTVGIHKTLCFHLGMTECFVWDYGTEQARATEWPETAKLLKEIHNEIVKDDRKLIYSHKWEVGDFIISDNLAVGHEASPETQHDPNSVGLRVLHRTTVRGTNKPTKDRNTHGR